MPRVTFLVSNQTHEIAAGGSFLEMCQQVGAPHDFGCTVGSCGTCRLEIVSGTGNVNPASEDERETVGMCTDHAGARLGCMLKVNGDISVRPVD